MKVLFVGLGGAGQRHLRNLRALVSPEHLDLLAYRARGRSAVITESFSLDKAQRLEEAYNIRSFTRLEEALAQRPEAAIIANPTSLHVPIATALAEAGCHLLIEKPLSSSLEGVDRLRATVRGQGVKVLVGCQMRFHPGLQLVRRLLREEAIGPVLTVRVEVGSHLPSWHPYEDHRDLYAARRDLGGGVILTESHEIDYLCWFFGAPRRVVAMGGHRSPSSYDVEDTADALLEYEGRLGSFVANLHMSMVQQPPSRSCVLTGETGQIQWDNETGSVRLYEAAKRRWSVTEFPGFQRNQMFLDEMAHFLACARGEAEPLVPLGDGIATLKTALAIRRALTEQTIVEVEQ